ncbi:methyltransferase domain-containing protein [Candidatus Foliamicus sp.]
MSRPRPLQVRRSFDRCAEEFSRGDFLYAEFRRRMLEQLEWVRLEPRLVIDAGCGVGAARAQLQRRFPAARVLGLDSSLGMLRVADGERLCGDMQQMPLADDCAQLVFSNLALQWCPSIGAALAEFLRVLDSPGLLFFSMFGPDTLKELRTARRSVGWNDQPETLLDMHHLGDALLRAGFADPVMSAERFSVQYADYRSLENDLRHSGASRAMTPPGSGLAQRGRRLAVARALEAGRNAEGVIPVSIEVVYGQAWVAPPRGAREPAEVPLEQISIRKPGKPS